MYHEPTVKFSESWMNKGKKPTGWEISTEVTEFFKDYCNSVGQPFHRAQEAAMIVWTFLPSDVQKLAILRAGGKIPQVNAEFWMKLLAGLSIESIFDEHDQSEKPKKK